MSGLLVVFASSWGSESGGINAFNFDLVRALATLAASGDSVKVVCLVDSPPPGNMASDNLAVLHFGADADMESVERARAALALLRSHFQSFPVRWWFGHDVISGKLALCARDESGEGRCAIFHHMNYWAYTAIKHSDGDLALRRRTIQTDILRAADVVFAVGPKLYKSAHSLLPGDDRPRIVEVVPGLADTPVYKKPPPTFRATTFGRLTEEDDPIKQGRLSVRAVASLLARHQDAVGPDPTLSLIGVQKERREEIQEELLNIGREISGRVFSIQAISYVTSRSTLFEEIARSTVCMMLSLHEGFGLVGWESIAAGVPLVLSKNSGTFELLASQLTASELPRMVSSVDITGTGADSDAVAEALYRVAVEPAAARRRALALRERLSHFTWEAAADGVARHCDLFKGQEKVHLSGPTATERPFEVEMYWGYRPSAHEDLRSAILSCRADLVVAGLGLNTIGRVLNDPEVIARLSELIAEKSSFRPTIILLSNPAHTRSHERGGRLLAQKISNGIASLDMFRASLEESVPHAVARPVVVFRTYTETLIPRHFLLKADETLFVGSYLSHRQGSYSHLMKIRNQGDGLYALFDKEVAYVVENTVPLDLSAVAAAEKL